jgi:hypothetical protein
MRIRSPRGKSPESVYSPRNLILSSNKNRELHKSINNRMSLLNNAVDDFINNKQKKPL